MEYSALAEIELLDILASQTARYTNFLAIGALTPKQLQAKRIIDEVVGELDRRKDTESKNQIQRSYEFATANLTSDTNKSSSYDAMNASSQK